MNFSGLQEHIGAFQTMREDHPAEEYVLKLYVTGNTTVSVRAILNLKNFCEIHLKGRYSLQVVDIYQQPSLAKGEQIIATPTLIKQLPLPVRRLIGDMANTERVRIGLDLYPAED